MRIACLHTAVTNVGIYDRALAALSVPSVELVHRVRPDLLDVAEAAGSLTAAVRGRTTDAIVELAADADAVLLTCSTIGPVADHLASTGVQVARVDRAVAQEAVAVARRATSLSGRAASARVAVIVAAPTTVESTSALFAEVVAPADGDVRVEVQLAEGAWESFRSGDHDGYAATVAASADAALAAGASVVALAQSSMEPAVGRCLRAPVLSPPTVALRAALTPQGR